jgi:glycerophosphoryl diester phosphodiesterase
MNEVLSFRNIVHYLQMKVIGHRGAAGLAPENTLASIQKAIDHGVDEVEFDLRVTKDHAVVLHHDPFITDSDDGQHIIAQNAFAELRKHKPDLATFDTVLRNFAGKVSLLAEVKPDEPLGPIIKIVKTNQPANLSFCSFSQASLRTIKAELPGTPLVVNEKWSGVRAHIRARELGAKRVSMNQRWLWWGFIRGFKNSSWELSAYTLNDPVKAKRWGRWGLAGVITDYPDRFEKK